MNNKAILVIRLLVRFACNLLLSIFLALIIFEIGLRIAVYTLPGGAPEDSFHIPPRIDPTMRESIHAIFDRYRSQNEDDQWSTDDFTLSGYTSRDHERLTTDQPAHYTHTVWVFGSSSVWGMYVDDAHTIPSYLQREFNQRGIPWRVRNASQIAVDVTIEYYWLKHTGVQPGDMIIFLDGAVDLRNTVLLAKENWAKTLLPCQLSQRVSIMLVNLWCEELGRQPTPGIYLDPLVRVEFARYWRDVDAARRFTQAHGATWLHVMQPGILIGYDDLYFVLARGDARMGIPAGDYLDDQHYNSQGHELIARQLMAVIAPTF